MLPHNSSAALLLLLLLSCLTVLCLSREYPVPIPSGGRFDVHGWLVLPLDQEKPVDPSTPVDVWLSHHVPEFWTDSPHNFQIIARGQLVPTPSVFDDIYVIDIPYPPVDDLVIYEYSITPPSPFSLNDLLSTKLTVLNGVYYNGSFDTSYEREPTTLAQMKVLELTTAVYLNETEPYPYEYLQYLSYPRGSVTSQHFYLAHQIHAQPDFDHVVHVVVDNCVDNNGEPASSKVTHLPGSSWIFKGIPNTLEYKLEENQRASMTFNGRADELAGPSAVCDVTVLESIHCMIGPGFMENC